MELLTQKEIDSINRELDKLSKIKEYQDEKTKKVNIEKLVNIEYNKYCNDNDFPNIVVMSQSTLNMLPTINRKVNYVYCSCFCPSLDYIEQENWIPGLMIVINHNLKLGEVNFIRL